MSTGNQVLHKIQCLKEHILLRTFMHLLIVTIPHVMHAQLTGGLGLATGLSTFDVLACDQCEQRFSPLPGLSVMFPIDYSYKPRKSVRVQLEASFVHAKEVNLEPIERNRLVTAGVDISHNFRSQRFTYAPKIELNYILRHDIKKVNQEPIPLTSLLNSRVLISPGASFQYELWNNLHIYISASYSLNSFINNGALSPQGVTGPYQTRLLIIDVGLLLL